MSPDQFYDYIVENFNLDGASCRLIRNIITYVAEQSFVDHGDVHRHLAMLLDGTIGLTDKEIKKCRFN